MSEESATDQAPPSDAEKFQRVMLWIGGGALAGIVAICLAANWPSQGNPREDAAETACIDWVKDQLKAPSTADFSDTRISVDGDLYSLFGKVDSENSFGAKIRSKWSCTARDDGTDFTKVSVMVN